MMQSEILRNSQEYYFEQEGCFILEMSNSENDASVSIAKVRVLPNVTTQWHRLAVSERYVMMNGIGLVEIDDTIRQEVKTGDVVIIAAHSAQRITNTSAQDLIFLAICSPRFELKHYQAVNDFETKKL